MINFIRKSLHYVERKVIPLKPEKFYKIGNQRPLISFSFDDFPLSAGITGAGILKKYNIKGTFYISLGRLGHDSTVGKICDLDTIKNLIDEKHEIGSHTYYHTYPYDESLDHYEESIIKNEQRFKELFSASRFETFAYPFGINSNNFKKIVRKYFRCARTTTNGVNFGKVDVNSLKAFPVYGSGENLKLIKSAIQFTLKQNGWLNLYTHDITETPSMFGCTPNYFEDVVKLSVDSGASIVTIKEACDILSIPIKES